MLAFRLLSASVTAHGCAAAAAYGGRSLHGGRSLGSTQIWASLRPIWLRDVSAVMSPQQLAPAGVTLWLYVIQSIDTQIIPDIHPKTA